MLLIPAFEEIIIPLPQIAGFSLNTQLTIINIIGSSFPAWGKFTSLSFLSRTSLVAQKVKRLPTMQETRVPPLDWEDPLEKEMATHSNT